MITTPSSPTLSRLRAAAALIPLIQSGLADTKLSREQAASMTSFIEWAASSTPEDDVEQQLVNELTVGIAGLKLALCQSPTNSLLPSIS